MIKCKLEKCHGQKYGRGMCQKHYCRWLRYGDVEYVKIKRGENRSKHPLYSAYCQMKQRCYNPNDSGYVNYGGRGIKVCDRWLGLDGFSNFIKDMGSRPNNKTLDRIDNDSDYAPNNCRWASRYEQMRNRRQRKDNKSGTTGVSFNKYKSRWEAYGFLYGKQVSLGTFLSKDDAIKSRLEFEANTSLNKFSLNV